jgi:transglutaminase-like putative cysteine protease
VTHLRLLIIGLLFSFLVVPSAQAQLDFNTQKDGQPRFSEKGIQIEKSETSFYQVGVVIEARVGSCKGIQATLPIPMEWPEQELRMHNKVINGPAKVGFRKISPYVQQLTVEVPFMQYGQKVEVLVTYEISRHSIKGPANTDIFQISKKPPRDLRVFLATSPGIESTNYKIKGIARDLFKETEGKPAWERIERLYDWTRETIEYKNGSFKGAARALKDGYGDCEELTSMFIALCRANGVPARTVWIPGHCYPEFYLEDDEGKGHWIPCQAAGTKAFGSMPEFRPILQKGDNFKVPEKPRVPQRYVAEFLTGKGGKPTVKFIRKKVGEDGEEIKE